MNALDIVFAVGGLVIGFVGYIAGQKKTSHDDGQSIGVFIGEVKNELKHMNDAIGKLSQEFSRDREEREKLMKEMRAEFENMLKEAIKSHELIYHKEEK